MFIFSLRIILMRHNLSILTWIKCSNQTIKELEWQPCNNDNEHHFANKLSIDILQVKVLVKEHQ